MIIKRFKELLKQDNILQSVFLLSTTVLGLFLGFVINSILTRVLGNVNYGNYALITNVFVFCQVVFNFGFYYVISRLVAISKNQEKVRGYYTIGIFISFILFCFMTISVLVYAYWSDSIVKSGLTKVLILTIPFSWIYLFTNLNENYLQGDNKINLLSWSRILPKIIYVIFLTYIFFNYKSIGLEWVLILNFLSFIISYMYVIVKIKPSLMSLKRRWREILLANKRFGLDIYLGSIVASGSASLSGILIGYYGINNTQVGYYTLATLLVSPLSLIPNIIATVQFKKFAINDRIDNMTTTFTFVLSIILFILIYLLSDFLIKFIFGLEYIEAVPILKVLSLGYLLYGIGDFYNRFLLSKGRGKELRNASFLVGITLLLGNFLFIKYFGAMGASYARIASGLIYSLVIYYYYIKEIKL